MLWDRHLTTTITSSEKGTDDLGTFPCVQDLGIFILRQTAWSSRGVLSSNAQGEEECVIWGLKRNN